MIVVVNDLIVDGILFMAVAFGNIAALLWLELRLKKYIL